jgi:hypothetical protein
VTEAYFARRAKEKRNRFEQVERELPLLLNAAFSCILKRVPPPQAVASHITTAERLIQPAVEEKQFRMGSARNSRCLVRAVGDEEKWQESSPRI